MVFFMLTILLLSLKQVLACKIASIYSKKQTQKQKKTKAVVVEKRQSPLSRTSYSVQNNTTDVCKSCPYLGTIISNNEQFKLSINDTCKNASRAICTLSGNVNKPCAGNVRTLID